MRKEKSRVGKTFTLNITFTVTDHENASKGSMMLLNSYRVRKDAGDVVIAEIGASPDCSIQIMSEVFPHFTAVANSKDLLDQIEKLMPEIRKQIGLEEIKDG